MTRDVSISAVADLHGNLPEMKSASLVFIGGDIFPGELDKNPDAQGAWFRDVFLPWVDKITCRRVVLVAGNHDHWIEAHNEELLKEFAPSAGKKLVYLCDSEFEFYGIKMYGTPWVPTPFVNKAFSSDDSDFLREKYSRIPQNADILITHTVPYDCNHIGFSDRDMRDLGSKELREAVASRNVRFLIGGHIHETRERVAHMDFGPCHTEMVNVACCDNDKQPVWLPVHFTLSVESYKMREVEQRIRQDFSLALAELEFCGSLKEHPVYHELCEANKEFVKGIERNFHIEWKIVDVDESHIYVTNLRTGSRYHISVIYPAALYVDVYRVLDNGKEICPWV